MSLVRLYWRLMRWKYVLVTHRDYHNRLNRCSEVETTLWAVAAGRRALLTPEECRKLALKLGTPKEFSTAKHEN